MTRKFRNGERVRIVNRSPIALHYRGKYCIIEKKLVSSRDGPGRYKARAIMENGTTRVVDILEQHLVPAESQLKLATTGPTCIKNGVKI